MSSRVLALCLLAAGWFSMDGCSSAGEPGADAAVPDGGAQDAAAVCPADAAPHCLIVDDAGVSHGCAGGGMGPGDRDDGGGLPAAPPPDAAADAMNLPFGAECLRNAQCLSSICFDYRVKGQFCTQFCNCNTDCPPASLGCSGQGVCRVGP
jgi:hypothetical protein